MLELAKGLHNFSATGGSTFKLALYGASAILGPDTPAYTASGEITGTGYTAGGVVLTNIEPVIDSGYVCITFGNASWAGAGFSNVAGALIYNTSSNRAVCAVDFGSLKQPTAGTFTVQMPAATAQTALIKIQRGN